MMGCTSGGCNRGKFSLGSEVGVKVRHVVREIKFSTARISDREQSVTVIFMPSVHVRQFTPPRSDPYC